MTESSNDDSKRPVFLTILCVLTFISTFMGAFSAFFTPIFSEIFLEIIKANKFVEEEDKAIMLTIITAGWFYHILLLLLNVGSFAGAVLMWQLKKIGFHVYAISNLLMLFVNPLVLKMPVVAGGILSSIAFIGLYSIYLRLMK